MQTQAIVFDRDHTLVYFAPTRLAQFQAQLRALAPELSVAVVQAAWASWPGPWPRHATDEPAFWRSFWVTVSAELRPSQIEALSAEVGALYHTLFVAYPDTAAVIAALRTRGLRLAVLTNFELPSVDRTLAHAGLDPCQFEVMLSSAALGFPKPDARAFQTVAAALDLPPQACLFVDDLAENVAAARSIGMRAFQIIRATPPLKLDHGQISSLHDLLALLPPPSARA